MLEVIQKYWAKFSEHRLQSFSSKCKVVKRSEDFACFYFRNLLNVLLSSSRLCFNYRPKRFEYKKKSIDGFGPIKGSNGSSK